MMKTVQLFAITACVLTSSCWCQDTEPVAESSETTTTDFESVWKSTLDDAVSVATESNKPIFVIVGAEWCVYCKKLEEELTEELVDGIAEHWVLAKIDSDDRVSDARELRANGLPSLRLLSKDGIIAYSRDGYMPVAELQAWLDENHNAVKSNVPQMLEIDPADFTNEQVAELVEFVSTRDVTVRRIILDRLAKIPDRCVVKAIDLLESKRLAKQLSALELLRRWKAPIDGVDPWVPGSIDQSVITRLRRWSKENYPDAMLDA